MKPTKTFGLILFSLLMVFLCLAPAGQAREMTPVDWYELNKPNLAAESARAYAPAQFSAAWNVAPDLLVSCDPDGSLLASLEPGRALSTRRLNAAACKRQAAIDADQQAAAFGQAYGGGASCGYRGVSGDTRMLKISGTFSQTRYVYLQCGKKVGEFGPPACNCGSSWRYAYDCKKPPTVYITIPCR